MRYQFQDIQVPNARQHKILEHGSEAHIHTLFMGWR